MYRIVMVATALSLRPLLFLYSINLMLDINQRSAFRKALLWFYVNYILFYVLVLCILPNKLL